MLLLKMTLIMDSNLNITTNLNLRDVNELLHLLSLPICLQDTLKVKRSLK
jgi:hypothetical protein